MPFERKVSKVVAVYELTADGFQGSVPEASNPDLKVAGDDLDAVQYELHARIRTTMGDQVAIVDRVE